MTLKPLPGLCGALSAFIGVTLLKVKMTCEINNKWRSATQISVCGRQKKLNSSLTSGLSINSAFTYLSSLADEYFLSDGKKNSEALYSFVGLTSGAATTLHNLILVCS